MKLILKLLVAGVIGLTGGLSLLADEEEPAPPPEPQEVPMVVATAKDNVSTDRQGVITLFEGQGLRGLGPKLLVGRAVTGDEPGIQEAVRRGLSGDTSRTIVQTGLNTFDIWYSPLRDSASAVTGMLGVATNRSSQHSRTLCSRSIVE